MMNILATGASGMIGSRFLKLLPKDINLIQNIDRTNGFDILNLSDLKNRLENLKIDSIIHFAAFTDVNAAAGQEGNKNGACYQINVVGTQNIIELAKILNCHLIHISTDFVFDGTKKSLYTEEDHPNPQDWYSQTKHQAEQLVQSSGLWWCIVRTAYPFLAKFTPKLDLVRQRIQLIRQNQLPTQFTDHVISPTFIDQLSNALFTLIKNNARGIYHLVGENSLTDFEITRAICEIFGFNIEIKTASVSEYNKTAQRPYQQYMALSNKKFEAQFGKHFTTFTEALAIMKNQGVDVLS